MFGRFYFGPDYYGPRYFGDGGAGIPDPPVTGSDIERRRRFIGAAVLLFALLIP